jgi:glycosyltransferase involved in cell wall biosynthesis
MKRIIFFVDKEWSLGRYHSDLIKYLFSHGIDAQLLDYRRSYCIPEIMELSEVYDYFITTYHGVAVLNKGYGIPLDKMKVILYHNHDAKEFFNSEYDTQTISGIGTVSESILSYSDQINRNISMLRFGINTNTFKMPIPKCLNTIGFGGEYHSREETKELKNYGSIEAKSFKRGYLAKEIADEMGLNFYKAADETIRSTYITMPGFYNKVDCILCCSEDEGAGGPVLEGAAAGRLIITTNVGSYQSFVTDKGAIGLSVAEDTFKSEAKEVITYYKGHPGAFRDKCAEIRDFALAKYDLSNTIDDWVKFLNN